MPLQPPARTAAGFLLAISPVVKSPPVTLVDESWVLNEAWVTWAEEQRKVLMGELLGHGSWFSKPPRREVLEPLFSSWHETSEMGPTKPRSGSGTAVWSLDGLLMTATSIKPVWSLADFKDAVEAIPFFDGDTVDSGDDREIRLEDIEAAPPTAPTQIRNREWEAKKFLAKERVREARLKAQIAARMSEAEEARYYRHFGGLEDGESRFSDYDLSESEEDETILT